MITRKNSGGGVDKEKRECRVRTMKKKDPPEPLNRESLEKLPPAQLVEIVLRLQELILKQGETIERLKILVEKDNTTSSKPPSTDIIKKSEKPKEQEKKEGRRPGGLLVKSMKE
jgi:transposase